MTLAKVDEQDGMMLAKVKEQDGIVLAKVKIYISGLNRRGGHRLMKQLMVVKGIGRGFRICCRS